MDKQGASVNEMLAAAARLLRRRGAKGAEIAAERGAGDFGRFYDKGLGERLLERARKVRVRKAVGASAVAGGLAYGRSLLGDLSRRDAVRALYWGTGIGGAALGTAEGIRREEEHLDRHPNKDPRQLRLPIPAQDRKR